MPRGTGAGPAVLAALGTTGVFAGATTAAPTGGPIALYASPRVISGTRISSPNAQAHAGSMEIQRALGEP